MVPVMPIHWGTMASIVVVVSAIVGVIAWFFKVQFASLLAPFVTKVDKLTDSIDRLNKTLDKQAVKLEQIDARLDEHENRLGIQKERLHNLSKEVFKHDDDKED